MRTKVSPLQPGDCGHITAEPPRKGDSVDLLTKKLARRSKWIEKGTFTAVSFTICPTCEKLFASRAQSRKIYCSRYCNGTALFNTAEGRERSKKNSRKHYAHNKDEINRKKRTKKEQNKKYAMKTYYKYKDEISETLKKRRAKTKQNIGKLKTGITGVRWAIQGNYVYAVASTKQINGHTKCLYHGKDFFDACCARKRWESLIIK